MFGISIFFFNVLTIWHVLFFFFWMWLVSSESYHWTCWIADMCPLLGKCPNPDVSSDNFHCTQAISLFSFCWYYCIWWEREIERERESYCTHERKKECPNLFGLSIVKSCESHAFQNTYKNNTQHCYSKTENCFGCIQNTVFKHRKFLIFDSNTPTKHTFFFGPQFLVFKLWKLLFELRCQTKPY